jgi:hypothetical protein
MIIPSCYLHNGGILLHHQTNKQKTKVMKKISLILAAMVLFAGVSFAQDKTTTKTEKSSSTKTEKTTKTEKKGGKKGGKKEAKASAPAAK